MLIKNNSIFLFYTFVIVCLVSMTSLIQAQQQGSITGIITDNSNNEVLIGANVLVVGTTSGASTDIDGKFNIKNLQPGKYSLKVSYVSYQPLVIELVEVNPGQNTNLNISLSPASTEIEEVVVTAEALRTTETSVLKIQKNSSNIVDGISTELIKKNNSSDGTDVLKRMTGVTISEGKYVFVRGVGDRYNNTLLNGASLPSTDPEKKSFSYDIFPANLIENVITSKTFTPDKPADFSGGLVQINTIEFPNKFTLDLSTTSGYNSNTTFKTFTGYSGGKSDWLAYDDGTRDFPSIISDKRLTRGNYTDAELTSIASSFKNNWNLKGTEAPINGSYKISVGDKYDLGEDVLGYIAALNYSNSLEVSEKEKNFYDNVQGSRYLYTGSNYLKNTGLGGMLNVSYKLGGSSKFSFKNIFSQNSDDEVTNYKGDYRFADQYRDITSLRFISRSLRSHQLLGETHFDLLNGLNWDWGVSYSHSDRNEPDGRRYVYSRGLDEPSAPLAFLLDQSISTRFYGKLSDNDYSFTSNFNLKPFDQTDLPKISFGVLYNKKDREFDARIFGFRNLAGTSPEEQNILQLPVEQIFQPQNINQNFISVIEVSKPSDSYDSNQKVAAGYLMFDASIEKLRIVSGVRFEYSNQNLISASTSGQIISIANYYRDWLPSLNLTYTLNEFMNLRFAYSTTLARPEFREMAPFQYFDFIENEKVQGNTELTRTLINNFDLRYEVFPGAGELVAFSLFYKRFINPLESILIAAQNEPIRSYANAASANNYGAELELRKNFSFLSDDLKNFSFVGNLTLVKSKIKVDNSGSAFQENERPLQGQAEYVFNFGLYFDDFETGFNSSLVYNKVGSRISRVGFDEVGDIIEKPVDLIDFSVSKKVFDYFTIKLNVKDLLNQEKEFIQQTSFGDKISELKRTGRTFSVGLAYQL